MNAYELADDVKNISNTIEALEWVQKATPLLRQQAQAIATLSDRIAELEKLVHQRFDDGKRLGVIETEDRLKQQSAEPFIWLKQDFDGEWIEVHPNKGIPLYTAPRDLSDEEIDQVALNNFEGVGRLIYMVQGNVKGDDFKQAIRSIARAILKKAGKK